MVEIELDVNKSVADNAADYYNRSKKAKSKLAGLKKAIADSKKQIKQSKEKLEIEKEKVEIKKKVKRKWFEDYYKGQIATQSLKEETQHTATNIKEKRANAKKNIAR